MMVILDNTGWLQSLDLVALLMISGRLSTHSLFPAASASRRLVFFLDAFDQ